VLAEPLAMPRAKPGTSFDVAVRHLFRHLHEPGELRRNPLVSRFFGTGVRRGNREQDAVIAAQVRECIAKSVECLKSSELSPAATRLRLQEDTIIARRLEGATPKQIASELRVSKSEFYRQYRQACIRVARHVQSLESAPRAVSFSTPDTLDLALVRARAAADAGDYDRAICGFDAMVASGLDPERRIECLCRRADVDLERGAYAKAGVSLAEASRVLAVGTGVLAGVALATARARVALLRSKVAWATADFGTAEAALLSAHESLEPFRAQPDERIGELLIDVLFECGNRHKLQGRYGAASECIREIGELAQSRLMLSPQHEIDCILLREQVALLSARPGAYDPAKYVALLNRALRLSKACGSVRRVVEIELELSANPFINADVARTTLDAARLLTSASRQLRNSRLLAYVSIYAADALVGTRFWRMVPSILHAAKDAEPKGSREWAHMALLQSAHRCKASRIPESRHWANEACRAAERSGSQRVVAAALRCLASAALADGRRGEAAEYLRSSLPTAERFGSSEARILTYDLAHAVTGDARYRRAAVELRQSLVL